MTQLAHDHESSATRERPRRPGILLAAALLVASGALFASVPARAADDGGGSGNGGAEGRGDASAGDHDGIYEAQRGAPPVCEQGEFCGIDTTATSLPARRRR